MNGAAAPPTAGSTYVLARWLFVRAVGLCYFLAILSLWTQVHGLIGENGIEPFGERLAFVRERLGASAYLRAPSLFWLLHGDVALDAVFGAGVLLCAMVMLGYTQGMALALLWAIYLSIDAVGGDFLQFQWDALLLETGFMTIFLAPFALGPRASPPPCAATLWLPRLLCFRLMFGSGVAKLAGGDPTWRDLSALTYHYETQPLPTPVGWYVHHLPASLHRATTFGTFVVELAVPFLIFAPWRRLRTAGALAMMGLQAGIAATGNYCYFNLLSAALCLPILDDAFLRRFVPARLRDRACLPEHRGRRIAATALAVALVLASLPMFALGLGYEPPEILFPALRALRSFGVASHYGLFTHMTTTRPEIVIEGSADGITWLPYGFRYKPGDPSRRPTFVAPHHPRLDWQMWFAALGNVRGEPWFLRLLQRLLEGSPEVLALMGENPFPDRPPRFVRATLFDYRMTGLAEKRATGAWWSRRELGPYCPPLQLSDFERTAR